MTLFGLGNGAGGGSVLIKSPGSASGGAAAGPDPGAGSGLLLQPASKRARGRSAPSRPVTPRPVPSCPPVPREMVLGAPGPAPQSHPNGAEPFQQLWVGAFGHRTPILCRIPRPVQRKAGCCHSFGSVVTRRARVSKCHDAKKKKTPSELGRSGASILVRPRWVGMQAVSRAGGSRRGCFSHRGPGWKTPVTAGNGLGLLPTMWRGRSPAFPEQNLSPNGSVKTSERFPPSRQHPGRLQALSPGAPRIPSVPRPAEWCRRSPGAGGSRSAGGGC